MTQDDRRKDFPRPGRLALTRKLSAAALVVERAWPLVVAFACLVALFLTLSWFGLFAAMPFAARVGVLALLAGLALFALWHSRHLRWPGAAEVDARIELVSRLQHQPLRTQDDHAATADPFALALWREHQRRMAAQLRHLSGGSPRTRTERLDPFGLRAMVALLFVTAFAFSFGPGGGRVVDAFGALDVPGAVTARVDAWVTPPTYTGKAPVFLTEAGPARDGPVVVPEGSVLSVRISDATAADLSFTPARDGAKAVTVPPVGAEMDEDEADAADAAAGEPSEATKVAEAAPPPADGPREFVFTLEESGAVALATAFSTMGRWTFDVTEDQDPLIAFKEDPSVAQNGALQLVYTVSDDYGARKGEAEIVVEEDSIAEGARPLVAPPEINLALPRRAREPSEGRTNADLTESPYAGAKVAMTLVVTDDAAQTGRSETKRLTLPERRFSNPLARAVIEQRRLLALDADSVDRVVEMLDAVMLRGEEFIESPADYLALTAVRTRIATAHDDAALLSAVDFMWEIALGIEDGNLSLAERRLRDAREQLAEALENGATDAEIDALMQELREAMQEYMQALAEAMQNQPPMNQQQLGDVQEIRPQDLERMMDRIEDLAKSGSKDAAQQLLSELQQMMDNLQAMRPGQQQQGGEQNAMQEQMNKMGELLQRQQQLMDQTYDLGRQQIQRQQQQQQGQQGQQGEPQQGEPGQQGEPMTAEEMQEMMKQLQEQQGQLQEELQAMQQELEGMGMEPSEGFGEAGEAMGEAEGALGEGNDGEAVGQQGRAMEAMRRGAQDMMQQMQQAMQQGQQGQPGQPGQGQMGQGFNGMQQRSGRDPLGRQRQTQGPDFGQDVGVPDEIDTQRARQILDAIRERLGDSLSPQLEREYLERLLQTP
ncbi:TIGR02302 family protein [Aurantimonas sp. HBX-1]|uniref:TIGR02302 family protein n=1 Tax=Aurantimonas sp. HBX-1 TaxID=2906072 RepID=UPI001F38AEEE|nr:TIGR02302 family protein [Aurantimonas sp. HBX-1]UIJ72408.1 TIGR02302 family protein [Aurantimonas sp. HBX-1]